MADQGASENKKSSFMLIQEQAPPPISLEEKTGDRVKEAKNNMRKKLLGLGKLMAAGKI
jgi:hypothetical protein